MIRVLHVLGGLGSGGAEALIMNWYRNIDRTKVQFDFLVRSTDSNYVGEIEQCGGRIFYTASFPRHVLLNYIETDKVFQRKEWEVIHVHGNAAIYMLPLYLAKKYGYKKIIMHSHNVSAQKTSYELIHRHNRKRISEYATIKLACSDLAGHWMFRDGEAFTVIKNAIQIDKFKFNPNVRKKIRNECGLEDCFVIGNVGRFSAQKNHRRLLSIFKETHDREEKARLLLVGDGELEGQIRQQAKELGLDDLIIFVGRQQDVGAFLSAMDVFLFPSFYEGLGNVLVEAMTSGLPCLSSEEATVKEVKISSGLETMKLSESDSDWGQKVIALPNRDRTFAYQEITAAGYDAVDVAKQLEIIYCG